MYIVNVCDSKLHMKAAANIEQRTHETNIF